LLRRSAVCEAGSPAGREALPCRATSVVQLLDQIAGADDGSHQDVRPQTSLPGETGTHTGPRDRFQVIAGGARLDTQADRIAHSEAAAHERVDIDSTGE